MNGIKTNPIGAVRELGVNEYGISTTASRRDEARERAAKSLADLRGTIVHREFTLAKGDGKDPDIDAAAKAKAARRAELKETYARGMAAKAHLDAMDEFEDETDDETEGDDDDDSNGDAA